MLDLTKLAQQMERIGTHLNQEAVASRHRLERAENLLSQARSQQTELVHTLQQWRDRLGFMAAEPLEPLNTRRAIATSPEQHTVIATDGSQIAPSHHEIAYCYLINVGRVVLHYGQNRHPLLDSVPELFYRPEDLYGCRQWGIRTDEWMGFRRTVAEAIELANLTLAVLNTEEASASSQISPTLAMVDGSLIHWFLDPLPSDARDRLLPPVLAAWDRLKQAGVPLVGYLSASRSAEVMNILRLQSCPYDAPDCATHCPGNTDMAPCNSFSPLRDTALWATQLQPGQRSPIFRSYARILAAYGDHAIHFCYVHVGAEVARVEFPAWVAHDPKLLNTALTLTIAQVQKGYGYPVVLAEAHNQAVVRGGDRARFFALLEHQMIRAGLQNIGTSYKAARKRGSIA